MEAPIKTKASIHVAYMNTCSIHVAKPTEVTLVSLHLLS